MSNRANVLKWVWLKLCCRDSGVDAEARRMSDTQHKRPAYLTAEDDRLIMYDNKALTRNINSVKQSKSLNFEMKTTEATSTASSNTSSPPPYTYYLQPKTPYNQINTLVRSATQQMASFKPFPTRDTPTTTTSSSNYANHNVLDKNLVTEEHNYSLINNEDLQSPYYYADENTNNYIEMQHNEYDELDERVIDTAANAGTRSYLLKEITRYQIRFAQPEIYDEPARTLKSYTLNHVSHMQTTSYKTNAKFKTMIASGKPNPT
jgi:hypothetical protein